MNTMTNDTQSVSERHQEPMATKDMMLSMKGRITRAQFWGGLVLLVFVVPVTISAAAMYFQGNMEAFERHQMKVFIYAGTVLFGTVYAYTALTVKRLHDMNKSGLYALFLLVPGIGFLALLGLCGLMPGSSGANDYGLAPYKEPEFGMNSGGAA